MASDSKIEWTDSTFNPWIGCTKISPACDHCYAEADMDHRRHRVKWGAGQSRSRTSADYWRQPLRWNSEPFWQCPSCGWRGATKYGGTVECGTCGVPAIPARRRVFCASLADVFDNEVDPQWRADLFALIRATPNLDWLLLTKRIGNATDMIADAIRLMPRDTQCGTGQWNHTPIAQWPWDNVWIGATVCNQAEASRDIPKLLSVPARVRFLSMEPLLGRVDLCEPLGMWWNQTMGCFESTGQRFNPGGLDWVIAGGESGAGARPMHPDWVRALRNQCAAAGVPFLFKQWGEWRPMPTDVPLGAAPVGHFHGDQFFCGKVIAGGQAGGLMQRAGKKAAGRLLDGVEHNGFPEVRHG